MSSVVSSWLTDHKLDRPIGMPNYALVSRDYCNVNARMDFHFTMVDAVCAVESRNNNIQFRFKGGGTTSLTGASPLPRCTLSLLFQKSSRA